MLPQWMDRQPNHQSMEITCHKVLTYQKDDSVTSLVSDITMKVCTFSADSRSQITVYLFLCVGKIFSTQLQRNKTVQLNSLKGLFQKCVDKEKVFHCVIRKQTSYTLILLVCQYLLIGNYHTIVVWLSLLLQQQNTSIRTFSCTHATRFD